MDFISKEKDNHKKRENLLNTVEKILKDNNIKYYIDTNAKNKFIKNNISMVGERELCISHDKLKNSDKLCSLINKKILSMNGHIKRDNYNTLFLSCNESIISENNSELSLPSEVNAIVDLATLLDNTDDKKIYLTSDWHLFQTHYKHEKNYVNTQKIISWCHQNIKDNDIFMYLGDISFRYCNEEDQKKSMNIINSLPGIKVLIAGNHDKMLGDEYINGCGFKYVFDEFIWHNLIFTHRPIIMDTYPNEYWNIHGHIHKWRAYNTTNGKKNINVYPWYFDNKPVTLNYILNHKEELVKDNYWNNNAMLSETKRSELPDSLFGIPEDRKYPLDNEHHIKSAIKLFGHAEENKKKKLAKNIYSASKKYDISIPENTQCYKYLKEGGIQEIIPSDVTTIVFDMGNVLVSSDLEGAFHNGLAVSHLLNHEIEDLIYNNIFYNKELNLDHMSIEEIKDYFLKIAPDNIKPFTNRIFELIGTALYKLEYTDVLIDTLKSKGYFIYYLSNWGKWSYNLQLNLFNQLINKFDGGLFSFESLYSKPDENFYNEFFNKYNLQPEKCFFFDDKPDNIITGEKLGMRGIIFNKKETPKLLLNNNFNIPSNINNSILIDTGIKLEAVDTDKINWWYCAEEINPSGSIIYRKYLYDAIKDIYNIIDNKPKEFYIFTSSYNYEKDSSPILVGKILVQPNKTYEWLIQYPIKYINDEFSSNINEWAMASCNPIRGITKPFILKISNDSGLINTKQYALSPDIISDKYLVINENAQLEIVNSDIFKDCYIEIYEYIGDPIYLNKLNEAYRNNKIVDNTVFYTYLTDKPMLCEDQIDFDPNFKKVDLNLMQENIISEIATFRDDFLQLNNINGWISVNENSSFINKPSFMHKYKDTILREDIDGYYFYNILTHKRTSSESKISDLSESMIQSIL